MMIKCNSSWRRCRRCCRLLLCVIWPRGASLSQNWANRRSRSDSATAYLSLCGKMMMFFVFSFRNHSHFCAKGQTDCTFSLLLLLLPVSHGQKPDKAIRYRLMCDMLRGVHVRLCVCVCVCRQQVVFVCFKIFNYFRVSFVVCLFIKSGKSRG